MPQAYPTRGDQISRRVNQKPILYVLMLCMYAFLAGFGGAIILALTRGTDSFRRAPMAVLGYATVAALLCTILFSWILIAALRRR